MENCSAKSNTGTESCDPIVNRTIHSLFWNPETKEITDKDGRHYGTSETIEGVLNFKYKSPEGKWYKIEGEKANKVG